MEILDKLLERAGNLFVAVRTARAGVPRVLQTYYGVTVLHYNYGLSCNSKHLHQILS